jgi:hypothetical protein
MNMITRYAIRRVHRRADPRHHDGDHGIEDGDKVYFHLDNGQTFYAAIGLTEVESQPGRARLS